MRARVNVGRCFPTPFWKNKLSALAPHDQRSIPTTAIRTGPCRLTNHGSEDGEIRGFSKMESGWTRLPSTRVTDTRPTQTHPFLFTLYLSTCESGRKSSVAEICDNKSSPRKEGSPRLQQGQKEFARCPWWQGMLKAVVSRLSTCYEAGGIPPEEQCRLRPARSTDNMLLVVRRLQVLERASNIYGIHRPPESILFTSVERIMLLAVLPRFGIQEKVLIVPYKRRCQLFSSSFT